MLKRKILLGSDYDGTFRRHGSIPDEADVEAAKRLREKGHIFGIVTGRTPAEMAWILDRFDDICDFILCATGGLCLFPDGTMIDNGSMDAGDICELIRICKDHGSRHVHSDAMSLSGDFTTVEDLCRAFPKGEDEGFLVNGYVDSRIHCAEIHSHGIEHISTITQFTSYFENGEECRAAIDAIEEAFPRKYKCHYLGVGFDMTRVDVSKTKGIARVAEHFGIDKDNVYTAGDGWNDVDMLKTYHGISMSGTGQGIMNSAEWVYDSVGEAIYGCILDKE